MLNRESTINKGIEFIQKNINCIEKILRNIDLNIKIYNNNYYRKQKIRLNFKISLIFLLQLIFTSKQIYYKIKSMIKIIYINYKEE